MKRIVSLLAGVGLLMALFATPAAVAEGMPPLPHSFYGAVEIDGSPAPVGIEVEARGEGVRTTDDNPITVTEAGKYGKLGLGSKLVVQGDIADGATITFYVDGVAADETAEWHSGGITELDLTATSLAPYVPPYTPPAAPTVDTNLFGTEGSFETNSAGELQETIVATSADGNLTITIEEGTICLDIEGEPLETLEGAVDETPPDPPVDSHIIGLAYDFGPDGATFDPPITLTYIYDPEALPDVADLFLAYYDEETGEWVELPCTVDSVNHTITASVAHFTTFAIIGWVPPVPPPPPPPAAFSVSNLSVEPAEIGPEESVTISVSVLNYGGKSGSYKVILKINDVAEQDETVSITNGASKTVTFIVSKAGEGTYSVDVNGLTGSFSVVVEEEVIEEEEEEEEEETPIIDEEEPDGANWPVVGGITAGVIVVGLLAFFIIRGRAQLTK